MSQKVENRIDAIKSKGAHGGRRKGAGRPKLLDASKAQKICQNALMKKYGVTSLAEAIEKIYAIEIDPGIRKFILTHALGNVPQTVNNTHADPDGNSLPNKIIVEVVRTETNKNVTVGEDNNA